MAKQNKTFIITCGLILCLSSASNLFAANSESDNKPDDRNPFQKYDLYRTPVVPTPSAEDRTKNCYALEHEMAALVPKTYSYKPDFYNDPYQGAAVWIGTTLFMPAYALSGYSGYRQYTENARMISAEERIALLRHLKAQNRCFET
ncbi:hypothetical protein [Sedimenticola selenatireducens]|jgi:hypothetical protein|uniref:Uncharacterized protein n=1 Tax=Sedimenticola selenatireducens TaxID=191960 RepID=A0A558DL93_9GAMM|nr:hypothetical protein [Sedimenticola selenatireducens]TVO67709.1 hypothetical protein FHP88_18950 [Sedimenticola selenatireducens]TVT61787.1 MAG: hypothetical protein FHK78_16490 [Sedimenticola selenatireducens]